MREKKTVFKLFFVWDFEKEVIAGAGIVERHDVAAGGDARRLARHQGFRGRGQDAVAFRPCDRGGEEEDRKSLHQAGIGPSYE